MTIAYIISGYRLPEQLIRLVSRLQFPGRTFYIHVDLNTPVEIHHMMVRELSHHGNVEFLTRHACHWGDFGHVRATLKGIERIVTSPVECDYVILLTGQDYPIKTNGFAEDYLSRHEGASFMNYRPLPLEGMADGGYDRLERWHFVVQGKSRAFPSFNALRPLWRRRVPYGLPPYFGSGYWCLHRQAVRHVAEFLRTHPAYVRFFRHVRIPDEMFFQTILLNSPLRHTIVNDDLRLIKWPGPKVFTLADWDEIRAAPDLFARKFDGEVDKEILDKIDREILGVSL